MNSAQHPDPAMNQLHPVIVTTIVELRTRIAQARAQGRSVGFVPTMGALHAGHRQLMDEACRECGFIVVSIFVNPLQFDRKDDLERYPRTLAQDEELCAAAGVNVIFAPTATELYPQEQFTFVDVPALTNVLCGAFRPGHFRGVATVVAKLIGIGQLDRAYFGQKDAQQLAVIRRMVQDLNFPLEIRSVPTVRETDGLALSSRNRHLTPTERATAPVLAQTLFAATNQIQRGENSSSVIRQQALETLGNYEEIRVEYFDLVDTVTLQPVEKIGRSVLIAAAVWLGATRLIDNVVVEMD